MSSPPAAAMTTAEKQPNFFDKVLIVIAKRLPFGPGVLGLLHFQAYRTILQKLNLYPGPVDNPLPPTSSPPPFRTGDASGNNPQQPSAGASGTTFGRNMPAADGNVDDGPPVQLVAQKLLARKEFVPAGDQLNVLAASWIQAMSHDWMGHVDGAESVELGEGHRAGCPLKAFRFPKTATRKDRAFVNARTHWWDASFLYGQNEAAVQRARTMRDGKLQEGAVAGILPVADDETPLVGDPKNGWIGVSLLQDLFLREHNLVAETLAREHPEMAGDDEKLFNTARLVISAVVAKVHTVDWTCQLMKTETVRLGMFSNWYGLPRALGLSDANHSGLGGLVGNQTVDRGVPYALTEEFVAVYRLHPLLPDGLPMPNGGEYVPLSGLVGPAGEKFLRERHGAPADAWNSIVRYPCGSMSLFNYPRALRDVKTTDNLGRTDVSGTAVVDLAALDLYRDRERGIKRYNDFRRALHLEPFRSYTDLTGLPETSDEVEALTEVYGKDGIEKVDLLVGNLAEKKIEGFAVCVTSFYIFLLMASRRLEADRFFTTDFNETTYTRAGFAWVNGVDGIKGVLARHLPHVAALIPDNASGFTPTDKWPKHAI